MMLGPNNSLNNTVILQDQNSKQNLHIFSVKLIPLLAFFSLDVHFALDHSFLNHIYVKFHYRHTHVHTYMFLFISVSTPWKCRPSFHFMVQPSRGPHRKRSVWVWRRSI